MLCSRRGKKPLDFCRLATNRIFGKCTEFVVKLEIPDTPFLPLTTVVD